MAKDSDKEAAQPTKPSLENKTTEIGNIQRPPQELSELEYSRDLRESKKFFNSILEPSAKAQAPSYKKMVVNPYKAEEFVKYMRENKVPESARPELNDAKVEEKLQNILKNANKEINRFIEENEKLAAKGHPPAYVTPENYKDLQEMKTFVNSVLEPSAKAQGPSYKEAVMNPYITEEFVNFIRENKKPESARPGLNDEQVEATLQKFIEKQKAREIEYNKFSPKGGASEPLPETQPKVDNAAPKVVEHNNTSNVSPEQPTAKVKTPKSFENQMERAVYEIDKMKKLVDRVVREDAKGKAPLYQPTLDPHKAGEFVQFIRDNKVPEAERPHLNDSKLETKLQNVLDKAEQENYYRRNISPFKFQYDHAFPYPPDKEWDKSSLTKNTSKNLTSRMGKGLAGAVRKVADALKKSPANAQKNALKSHEPDTPSQREGEVHTKTNRKSETDVGSPRQTPIIKKIKDVLKKGSGMGR